MAEQEAQQPAPESRLGGELGDISKLLQERAPDALAAMGPQNEQREPTPSKVDREREAAAAGAELGKPDPEPAPDAELTAAELEAAEADKKKKAPHDAELPVDGLSVKDIAARLGVSAKKIYDDLRIPLPAANGDGAGRSVSIGELKDMTARVITHDADVAKLGEDRDAWQNDVMVARQEMGVAVETISNALVARFGQQEGRAILAEAVGLAQRSNTETRAQNSQKLYARFPTWKDDKVRSEIRDSMVAHLQPWGFTKRHVDSIDDPQTLAYIHANMQRDAAITAARTKAEKGAPAKQRAPAGRKREAPPAARNKSNLVATAKLTGRREDINAGVGAILGAANITR